MWFLTIRSALQCIEYRLPVLTKSAFSLTGSTVRANTLYLLAQNMQSNVIYLYKTLAVPQKCELLELDSELSQ